MKKYNTFTKIVLYITFLSAVVWTGSYLLRMFIFYQPFTEINFELKDYLKDADLYTVFYTVLPAVTTTVIAYSVFLLSFILFFFLSGIKLRQNGWFFIILMILAVTAPFEIYLMTIDASIISGLLSGSSASNDILTLVIKRFKVLGSFPIIELLCFMAIFYLVLFQPLKKKYED